MCTDVGRRIIIFFLLIQILEFRFTVAVDSISATQIIRDSESITSSDEAFRLGFFSPSNSITRYVGIWYNTLPGEKLFVWVANRESPLNDSSGALTINAGGDLVVLDGKQTVVWATNVSVKATATANTTFAQLLNSGNLVLREIVTGTTLWQSFEHMTDIALPGSKVGANTKTREIRRLTSWKTNSDPSEGRYRMELEPLNIPQIVVWNGSQRLWRSGPWNGRYFIGVEGMQSDYITGLSLERDDKVGSVNLTFSYSQNFSFTRFSLSYTGKLTEMLFDTGENRWVELWGTPVAACDYYGNCGSFGFCNLFSSPVCSCLRGYSPGSPEEWRKGNWSNGCVRRTPLQCEHGGEGKTDGFIKYTNMKVPDNVDLVRVKDMEECKQTCLLNCFCTTYSYLSSVGCLSWHGKLLDVQKLSTEGVDLYIRVPHSELDKKKNKFGVIVLISVLGGVFIVGLSLSIYFLWIRTNKQNGNSMTNLDESSDAEEVEEPEIPLFKYEKLAVATDNFSLSNKLGKGGFGSVYKGELPNGQEIAVKRLSKTSLQGAEEFKTEVAVISKLQHRNLVRILGCCIEGEERMLVYEYMPNKSLDAFLFGTTSTKKAVLEWRKCFEIIEGIGRGILYLHRDSRLRVIHRDLKPSNILLDKDLNPRIADFGMARMFAGDELDACTNRVVGTYGYMSPEYAMEGQISEKSDVYSFGVVLLEIITGMKNTRSYHHHGEYFSLIRHVWKLWNQGEAEALIDPTMYEPSFKEEMLICIQVGLLCVQDFANDRPNMSSIISMLTSEITSLPTPNQPAFMGRQVILESSSSQKNTTSSSISTGSINNVSITNLEGR